MTTKTVTIAGLSVDLSTPYVAGHTLTEAEAKTLNQVRVENIRNNMAKAVKDAGEDAEKLTEVKAKIADYDREYVFTLGGTGASTTRLDPVDREALAIAKEFVKAHLAKTGRTFKTVPEGMSEDEWKAKLQENIERVAASDAVVVEAKKAVAAKAKRTEKLAEAIDLG
jgi:hypothetical protein